MNGIALRVRSFPAGLARVLALAGFSGFFLSAAGAFDTEAASIAPRLSYWLAVALLSSAALEAADRALVRLLPGRRRGILRAAGIVLLFLPLTFSALLLCQGLFGGGLSLARYGALLPGMTSILISLQLVLAFSAATAPPAAQPGTKPGPLVEALPIPLRRARLIAIHAQDHYVEVHTSAGQALVRMRFSDAVAAASTVPGYRPHRSWWVAGDSVRSLRRREGRLTLCLESGVIVPVSRAAARSLGPQFGPLELETPDWGHAPR